MAPSTASSTSARHIGCFFGHHYWDPGELCPPAVVPSQVHAHRVAADQRHSSPPLLDLRATDVDVYEVVERRPLSVSADRIAYPALRMARSWARTMAGCTPPTRAGTDVCAGHLSDALVAWAKAIGLCRPIPNDKRALATVEGWIALP
jgi:hypothetical protein